jgi:white-opaque regulator 2
MDQMKAQTEDFSARQSIRSLEARLVWQLATLPRLASSAQSGNGLSNDPLTLELLSRITTLEHLLTGQFLPSNQIPYPPSPDHQQDARKYQQQKFWHYLGRFASIRDDTPSPNALRDIEESLSVMRAILQMLENRDVLYSMAIARHIGGRYADFHPPRALIPQTENPEEDTKKLQIAQTFISQEDQKGTTQVIQRVCGMAMRSWVLAKQ